MMQGKWNLHSLLAGFQIYAATVGISLENFQKLKVDVPYDLSTPLLGTCSVGCPSREVLAQLCSSLLCLQ